MSHVRAKVVGGNMPFQCSIHVTWKKKEKKCHKSVKYGPKLIPRPVLYSKYTLVTIGKYTKLVSEKVLDHI